MGEVCCDLEASGACWAAETALLTFAAQVCPVVDIESTLQVYLWLLVQGAR